MRSFNPLNSMQSLALLACCGIAVLATAATAEQPAKGSKPPAAAPAAVAAVPKIPVPENSKLTLLVQLHITALSQANLTGNYTVLRDLGSPKFQANNSPEKLAENFSGFRKSGIDISPALLYPPILTAPPQIDADNVMHIFGFYNTRPQRIAFSLAFQPISNAWRMVDISVQTVVPKPQAIAAAPVADNGAAQVKAAPVKGAAKK